LNKSHHERQTRPNPDQLLETFPSVISGYSKVYFIIDAFDEYPEERRHLLLEYLTNIDRAVNVMITSRPHISLDSYSPNMQILDIRAMDNDIGLFIDNQILKSHRLSKHVRVQPNLHNEIRTQIIQKADGM
jgi:hypothetical protein